MFLEAKIKGLKLGYDVAFNGWKILVTIMPAWIKDNGKEYGSLWYKIDADVHNLSGGILLPWISN